MGKPMGRPKAEWQRELLNLKNHKDEEITLSEIAEKLGRDRKFIYQTLYGIVHGRRDYIYKTQELYQAMRKKLEEGGGT